MSLQAPRRPWLRLKRQSLRLRRSRFLRKRRGALTIS
nr:MAG TPA: hypothetical protein [Caudoviricetes sp.]